MLDPRRAPITFTILSQQQHGSCSFPSHQWRCVGAINNTGLTGAVATEKVR